NFDSSHVMPVAMVKKLFSSVILSPTSFNIQHWRFVRIRDAELRKQIHPLAMDQIQVLEASELLAITADVQAWQKHPERYWRNADTETRKILVDLLLDFYRGREWMQRDEAIRSGAFAAQNLMLAAKAMGYDSCPMIGFDQEGVARLINLPEDHVIVMLLAIGKAIAPAQPRGGQIEVSEILITDRFPKT
ncbi:MAG TPA: nitroreductase family protein, partial [Porticoccaceae bacterium]|nr:nitroreductase family protein [Porticoccaceae bacterium]